MKKISLIALIMTLLLVTGCGKKENTINGIEIPKDMNTYSYRRNYTKDYITVTVRYDKESNFKYYETTTTYYSGDYSTDDCTDTEETDFEDLKVVCKKTKEGIVKGYSFTDKTIAAGLLESTRDSLISRYEMVNTEEKVKELFEKQLTFLNKDDPKDFMIIANEKVELK